MNFFIFDGFNQGMADNLSANTRTIGGDDTLLAINLLIQFFFRQFHSDGYVRQLLIRRVNKEMQEGVQKAGATVNKIIKGLKVKGSVKRIPILT